jgi:hypothetical protein
VADLGEDFIFGIGLGVLQFNWEEFPGFLLYVKCQYLFQKYAFHQMDQNLQISDPAIYEPNLKNRENQNHDKRLLKQQIHKRQQNFQIPVNQKLLHRIKIPLIEQPLQICQLQNTQ